MTQPIATSTSRFVAEKLAAIKKIIAVFASGSGSNANQIAQHFKGHHTIRVGLMVSNRRHAGVHEVARNHGIPSITISRKTFENDGALVLETLARHEIRFIALAGFLLLIPPYLVSKYRRRMVNIHPALLPKFGGQGMYGMHVHRAVKEAGEVVSGPTIHYVTEVYDEGDIIFQTSCPIDALDTPETIRRKVLALEHENYPAVIESLLTNMNLT